MSDTELIREKTMKQYDIEDYYLYWLKVRKKPLAVGQKISIGLLDGREDKFGTIFKIEGDQDPESIKEFHFFNDDRKICQDLRIGGKALFFVAWEDGQITSMAERYLRNNVEYMLVPEISDIN